MQMALDKTEPPTFDPTITDQEFALSPSAKAKMAELYADVADDMQAIRVFVMGGGCGGMSYGMTFTDERTPHDCVLEGEGFNIYVDAVALQFLHGVEVDYVDQPLGGAKFVFNNVFAATGGSGTCGGCGGAEH